jgi:hypothetical protein
VVARKQAGPRDRLRKELVSLLDQVDDDGLVFLIRQAQTIIHNLQVDSINEDITELNRERAAKGGGRKAGAARRGGRPAASASEGTVTIDEGAGRSSFIIGIGDTRKAFSLGEMRALARVAQAAANDADGARRLYAWLSRNRRDVLIDMGARSAAHATLLEVHRAIRQRYRPRTG